LDKGGTIGRQGDINADAKGEACDAQGQQAWRHHQLGPRHL
jgi:hypothetical protein